MVASNSVFSRTDRAFENAGHANLTRHEIDFHPASQVMQLSSRLFKMLDRTDPIQSEVSLRLWVLRSSILFTVLPFEDSALRLMSQMEELEQSSLGLPDAAQLIESLKKQVMDIVSVGRNPKRELFLKVLDERMGGSDGQIGVFVALSAGKPPGWPSEKSAQLSMLSDGLMMIGSRRLMRANMFGTVILPCACSNTPPALLSDLLFSGCAAQIEVLLYKGERFQIPKRLELPDDGIFAGRLQMTEIAHAVNAISAESSMSAVDSWVNEAFWQGLHGADRNSSHNLVPANYMLFCDGTGTFLPVDGRILTLPADGDVTDEADLCLVRVENICEGDLIVLRSGDSGFLLDEATDRIMSSEDNESLFEIATDWKEALEALLVTHSNEEVAQALRERDVPTNASSIRQWIGPDVLGPGNERVFRELIYLLSDKGKIKKVDGELIHYADTRWKSLQELRGVRHKAGNLIRQDLFKVLFERIKSGNGQLSDGERIHVEGLSGAELLILRVSSFDRNPAYVSPSRLGQVDDLRGNKWLG